MNKIVMTLIEKFGGTLVGSAAAKKNGVNVDPNDLDLVFKDNESRRGAVLFLQLEGWKKRMISVPAQYMRCSHTKWEGRMNPPDGGLNIDLFVGQVESSVGGIATNLEVLKKHRLLYMTEDEDTPSEVKEYINKLVMAIATQ